MRFSGLLAPRQLLAAALEPWIESEVAYQAPAFACSVGSSSSPGVAAYTGVKLYAAAGVWRPALGVEVELASSLLASPGADEISGSLESQFRARDSTLLRAGMVVGLLRFRVERLVICFASLKLATPLDASAGERMYVGLALVNAGWAL